MMKNINLINTVYIIRLMPYRTYLLTYSTHFMPLFPFCLLPKIIRISLVF